MVTIVYNKYGFSIKDKDGRILSMQKLEPPVKIDKSVHQYHLIDNLIHRWQAKQLSRYGYRSDIFELAFRISGGTVQNYIVCNSPYIHFAYSSCQYDKAKPIGYDHEHRAAERTALLLNQLNGKIQVNELVVQRIYNYFYNEI